MGFLSFSLSRRIFSRIGIAPEKGLKGLSMPRARERTPGVPNEQVRQVVPRYTRAFSSSRCSRTRAPQFFSLPAKKHKNKCRLFFCGVPIIPGYCPQEIKLVFEIIYL